MTAEIHRSKVGTYHPAPPICPEGYENEIVCYNTRKALADSKHGQPRECPVCSHYIAWTIHDSRGYVDGGRACDECGACECGNHEEQTDEGECIGLSFSFVCLDGGENLCSKCAEKAGIEIVECDCA